MHKNQVKTVSMHLRRSIVLLFVSSMTYFFILFHRPLRLRRKGRRVKYYFFAVEGTAKENNSSFIKIILYWNTGRYFFILQGCMFLLSALSAESKKETNSLRPLRLCGDYKLSNYNTIPYLWIHVLSIPTAMHPYLKKWVVFCNQKGYNWTRYEYIV